MTKTIFCKIYASPVSKNYLDAYSSYKKIYRTNVVTSDITIKCLGDCFSFLGCLFHWLVIMVHALLVWSLPLLTLRFLYLDPNL